MFTIIFGLHFASRQTFCHGITKMYVVNSSIFMFYGGIAYSNSRLASYLYQGKNLLPRPIVSVTAFENKFLYQA